MWDRVKNKSINGKSLAIPSLEETRLYSVEMLHATLPGMADKARMGGGHYMKTRGLNQYHAKW